PLTTLLALLSLFPYTTLFRSSPPAPRVSCVYFSLFGSGFAGLGLPAIHVTADGRQLLVLHGDAFDAVVMHARLPSCFCNESTSTDRKSTRLNSSHQIISYAVF